MEVLSTYKHNLKRLAVAEYLLEPAEELAHELSDKLRDIELGDITDEAEIKQIQQDYYAAATTLKGIIQDIRASNEMIELCEEYIETLPFEYPEED